MLTSSIVAVETDWSLSYAQITNLINLAGIFQQLDKKVLIIDLDLYGGSIANALNKKYDYSIYNLVDDMIFNRFESFDKYVVNATEKIDILCAPKDPRDASKIEIKYIEDIINNLLVKDNFYEF